MRIRVLPIGIVGLALASAMCRGDPASTPVADADANPAVQAGEPLFAGFLIVDGEYVPPPYVVALDTEWLSINGHTLPHVHFRDWESDPVSEAGQRASTRRPEDQVARLERRLAHGELVLRSADGKVALFQGESALKVFSLTLGDGPRGERLIELLRLPGNEFGTRDWGRVLDRCRPTDELLSRVERIRRATSVPVDGVSLVHNGRSRGYSYALTVVGMLLVVVAFGTVLTFRPAGQQPWRTEDRSEMSVSLVLRCVVLMVVLSGYDLACTYLARSADQFSELNPLADTLLDTPAVLIGFKVAMTGLAALILWRLRFYRGTQVASWWLCLLLTLLAIRWVAVESLLMA